MRFTIETKPLKAALASLGKVIPARGVIPIVQTIKLVTSDDCLILTGTDLDTVLELRLPAAIMTEGEACISFAMANAFIAAAKGSELEIEVEKGQAVLRSGKSRIVLAALPAKDYPTYRPADGELVGVDPKTFAAALKFCVAAASDEETKYYLNGVGVQEMDGAVHLWGTNGQTMHHAGMASPPSIGGGGIVPTAAVASIVAMAEKAEEMQAMISDRGWHVRVGPVRAWGKVIDAPYPDCQRVHANLGQLEDFITADKADLSGALNVAICGADGANKVRSLVVITEAGKPAVMRGARGAQGVVQAGRAETEAASKADARMMVSAQYLGLALSTFPADGLTLAFAPGSGFVRITPSQSDAVLDLSALIAGIRATEAELADA